MTRTLTGRAGVWAASGLLAVCVLKAQSPAPQQKPLTFDVASVKPFSPSADGGRKGGGRSGPGTADPGRIHYAAIRLKDLMVAAYKVNDFQIVGPAWLEANDDTTRFAVDATMPPDTTKEELGVMLQNLLAERFKLAIHRETRDLPKYSLIVAKGGPKMKESTQGDMPEWVANPPEVADPIPDLFEALQSQMGLKLEAKKGPAEVIVIDHIEKRPTEN